MRIVMVIAVTMIGACQTIPTPVAPTPAVPKAETRTHPIRPRPDTVVQSYSQALDNDRARLLAQGLAADHAAVRAYVDAYLPAGRYTLQAAGATAAVQRRLRVDSVTNNLLNYGYRRGHFADAAQARRLVAAAMGVFGLSADGALATFAPTVLIADLFLATEPADGSSALIYRVVEPIKNAPPKGATIFLTIRTATAPSPFPPPPQPGEGELRLPGRVALFLSPPRAIGGLRGTGDAYARITQPMRLDGERLTPGYHSDVPEITLTRLRAVVRDQVCAPGYVPVGAKGRSLTC